MAIWIFPKAKPHELKRQDKKQREKCARREELMERKKLGGQKQK